MRTKLANKDLSALLILDDRTLTPVESIAARQYRPLDELDRTGLAISGGRVRALFNAERLGVSALTLYERTNSWKVMVPVPVLAHARGLRSITT